MTENVKMDLNKCNIVRAFVDVLKINALAVAVPYLNYGLLDFYIIVAVVDDNRQFRAPARIVRVHHLG